jgi:bifunctional ADP-heptose synthase (sugar kinase/adenylyltransferase)
MAIASSMQVLRTFLSENSNQRPVYMTSGGFDPMHVGHVRCIKGTYSLASNKDIHPWQMKGLVVVVVNADSFLIRKKGYAFMPLKERMEIIDSIEGVDFVVPWETDGDQTVCKAIEILKPDYFTKGGDRFDARTIPEWDICEKINCKIITGVGPGGKIQSSSDLVRRSNNFLGVENA